MDHALPPTLPDLPAGSWLAAASPRRGAEEQLASFAPRGLFKNDLLSYCKLLGVFPHPQLLPAEASLLVPSTMRPSAKLAERRRAALRAEGGLARAEASAAGAAAALEDEEEGVQFDFAPVSDVVVRNALVGAADLRACCLALRACAGQVQSLTLHNVGLSLRQIYELGDCLPLTRLVELSLEFNPLPVLKLHAHGPSDAPSNDDDDIAQPAEPTAIAAGPGGAEAAAAVDASGVSAASYALLPRRMRAGAWAHLCKRFSPLARVSLRGNSLGPAEAACIGEALAYNDRLEALILSHNRLGCEGARLLSLGLRENRGLRTLALAQNGLGQVGATALAQAVCAAGFPLTPAEVEARDQLSARVAAELASEARLFPPRPGGEPKIENPVLKQLEATASSLAAAAAAATAAVPPLPASRSAKPDPRAVELAAVANAAVAAAAAAAAAVASEAARPLKRSFPQLLPPQAAPRDGLASVGLVWGCGNTGLQCLDVANNPAIGVEGLRAMALHLVPDEAVASAEGKADGKEAEVGEAGAGLRVLVAGFCASAGDQRQLPPAARAEIENVRARLSAGLIALVN